MQAEVTLKIADIILSMVSRFPCVQRGGNGRRPRRVGNLGPFLHDGNGSDIRLEIQVVPTLPRIKCSRLLFSARHFQDNSENWRLERHGTSLLYRGMVPGKEHLAVINARCTSVSFFMLSKDRKTKVWDATDIVYDFLQVLLIQYCALHKKGIFVHGVGVVDGEAQGLLFAGKSGAGKTTIAKLWHSHSRAKILNDDRVIVAKGTKGYRIHATPWHGEFSDYLATRKEPASLAKIFFLHHGVQNEARRISSSQAYADLYPAIFAPFWDKRGLNNSASMCESLVNDIPVYQLGFVNNPDVINFVRTVP